jgi:hypothetical protein
MGHSGRTAAGVVAGLVLVSLTGCTGNEADPKPSHSSLTSPSKEAPAEGASAGPPSPAVDQAPELDSDETLAGRQHAIRGNGSVAYGKGAKGKALIVAVRCEGKGEIRVAVASLDIGFPLKCLAGEVTTTYNQMAVSGAERSGTVSVTAPTGVRWSMTIGRGAPAAQETPQANGQT